MSTNCHTPLSDLKVGDRLVAEDAYRCITAIEEANAEFEGWIMRPKTWYKFYQLRADAVAQGDRAGMFLFSMMRDMPWRRVTAPACSCSA